MTLSCPECNTPIEVEDEEYVVCPYCGIILVNNGDELEEYDAID